MLNKKATILGATGLIGSHLLDLLKNDESFTEIKILVRRQIDINHPKIKIAVIDFDDKMAFQSAIVPNSVIFCAVGTTSTKVKGNKDLYRKVDYDIPINAAKFGLAKDCQQFIIISSLGANAKSSNFYTKLKGEVEERLMELNYTTLHILRPSLLLGERKEFRFGEILAKLFMKTFSFLLPTKIKPIQASDIAKAMLALSKKNLKGTKIYKNKDMIKIINKI